MGQQNKGWFDVRPIELNETLKKYGFTQEKLSLLDNNAYWSKPYDWEQKGMRPPYWVAAQRFVASIPLLPPLSEKQEYWLWRIQQSIFPCQYQSIFHRGKIDWHHPIKERTDVGLYLCEAHHSILQGRKEKYTGELNVGKDLEQMRKELKELEAEVVRTAGLDPAMINKH